MDSDTDIIRESFERRQRQLRIDFFTALARHEEKELRAAKRYSSIARKHTRNASPKSQVQSPRSKAVQFAGKDA